MGSDAGAEQGVPPSPTGSGLFNGSGFMDGLKRSASTFSQKASDLAHQGLAKGKELAADPKTKQVEGEALTAGKQILQEHKEQGLRTLDAGKRGDIQGVLKNGLPLAAEAAMHANPIGLAITLAKPKVMEIAINHVPVEHQGTLKGAKSLVDSASAVTHFNIHGIGGAQQLLQRAADSGVQEQVAKIRGTGRTQPVEPPPPPASSPPPPHAFSQFDQPDRAKMAANFDTFLKQQAKKSVADNGSSPPPDVPKNKY
jgi:hypothetical protein